MTAAERRRAESGAVWGVTWVGGVLYYETREEAERKRRLFGSGSLVPPGSGDADVRE